MANMWAVVFTIFNVLIFASCHPAVRQDRDSCLVKTPEKQEQIKFLEKQLSEFLLKLEKQIGDMIITDVLLSIDTYSAEEARKLINFEVSFNKVIYFEEPNDTTGDNEDDLKANETTTEEADSVHGDGVESVECKKSSDDENLSNEVESNDEVIEEVEANDCVDNQENDITALAVQREITRKKNVFEQSTLDSNPIRVIPNPKPFVRVMIFKMNEEDAKMVLEIESIRGRRPFLLIKYKTGEQEIIFI